MAPAPLPLRPLLYISEVCYQLVPSTSGDTGLRGLGVPQVSLTELLIPRPRPQSCPRSRTWSISGPCWQTLPGPSLSFVLCIQPITTPSARSLITSKSAVNTWAPLPVHTSLCQPGQVTFLPTFQDHCED